MKNRTMKREIQSTYKSSDTEEWIDRVWTRPIGYVWARFFEHLNIHPNTVTILSMIIGASSALCFAHGSFWKVFSCFFLLVSICITTKNFRKLFHSQLYYNN